MDRDLIPFFKEDEIPYNFVTQSLGGWELWRRFCHIIYWCIYTYWEDVIWNFTWEIVIRLNRTKKSSLYILDEYPDI